MYKKGNGRNAFAVFNLKLKQTWKLHFYIYKHNYTHTGTNIFILTFYFCQVVNKWNEKKKCVK